jgi:hypothetical protein
MKTLPNLAKVLLLLVFIVLLLPTCHKSESELGKEIYFHVGERQNITSNLSFIIDSIWDLRCPYKMECASAGSVNMFFSINHVHKQIDTLLGCYPWVNMIPFDIAGYKWKVLAVDPHPDSVWAIHTKDDLISMIITEN